MSNKPIVFLNSGEVSDEFRSAFSQSGSDSIKCTACGRVHFCSGNYGGEKKDLEKLLRQQQEDPCRYIDHGDLDFVFWFTFAEQQIIFECPCRYDVVLEKIIWSQKRQICKYLVERAKSEKRKADSNLEAATKAAEAIRK